MSDRLILISRRAKRAKRVQIVQHLVAAVLLVLAAGPHLEHPGTPRFWWAVIEIAAAVMLAGSVIMERLLHRRHKHSKIGWVEVAGGLLLIVEAVTTARQHHHTPLKLIVFVPPLILIAFGLFDAQISSSRYLAATETSLLLRLRLLFRRSVAWDAIRAYRIEEKHLFLEKQDGKPTRLRIRDIENRAEAEAWLREQFARRDIVPL